MKLLPSILLIAVPCAAGCTDPSAAPPNGSSPAAKLSEVDKQAAPEILSSLKQIGVAFRKFEEANGAMPSAAIFSADGKPLLSWRVALLPYLNEGSLYKEFRLDEPWDGEHNRLLLAKMPAVFSPRRGPAAKQAGSTCYQVFTGPDAPFNLVSGIVAGKTESIEAPYGLSGGSLPSVAGKSQPFEGALGPKVSDFTDGTAQTFLVVEASEAVPWTKPVDLAYDAKKPLPSLGFGDRFYLVLADGSSHFLKNSVAEDIIRGGITPRGAGVSRPGEKPREPALITDQRNVLDQD